MENSNDAESWLDLYLGYACANRFEICQVIMVQVKSSVRRRLFTLGLSAEAGGEASSCHGLSIEGGEEAVLIFFWRTTWTWSPGRFRLSQKPSRDCCVLLQKWLSFPQHFQFNLTHTLLLGLALEMQRELTLTLLNADGDKDCAHETQGEPTASCCAAHETTSNATFGSELRGVARTWRGRKRKQGQRLVCAL